MTTTASPSDDDVFAQLDVASARTPQAPPPRPAAPAPDDVFAQLDRASNEDKRVLTQIVGEHAATQEVEQSAQRIASRPAPDFSPAALHADNVRQTIGELGHNAVQAPEGIYSGAVHAISELGASVAYLASYNTPQMAWEWLNTHYGDGQLAEANQARLKAIQSGIRGAADAITPNVDSVAGQLTKGVTQFAAAFIPVSRALRIAEGASLALRVGANAAAAGATQAAAFNPDDPRLSNLIQDHPSLANPVTDFLQTKPGDTEAEGRLKNFLEGAGLGTAGDLILEGAQSTASAFTNILKGMRASKSIAEGNQAVAAATPTPIDHPMPNTSTATNSDHYNVQEGELTDEQRRIFGLPALGEAGERPGNTGASAEVLSGADSGRPTEASQGTTVFRGAARPLSDADFGAEALGHSTGNPTSGTGVWFTTDSSEAARWGAVSEHQLFLKNPKVILGESFPEFDSLAQANAYQRKLIAEGYDGIVMKNSHLGEGAHDHYVAFSSDALKAPEVKPTPPLRSPETPKGSLTLTRRTLWQHRHPLTPLSSIPPLPRALQSASHRTRPRTS